MWYATTPDTLSNSSKTLSPAQPLLTHYAQILLMGYAAAFKLAETAKRYNLLGDSLVNSMIMTVALLDDPEVEHDAAEYIGFRGLENMFSGYHRNRRHR